MAGVAEVPNNPQSFPHTPLGVDVREGGQLNSNNMTDCPDHPLQSFAVEGRAVATEQAGHAR